MADLEHEAHKATIFSGWASGVSAILAFGALLFSAWTFHNASADQNQAAALSMLQKYLETAMKNPELAYRDQANPLPSIEKLEVGASMLRPEYKNLPNNSRVFKKMSPGQKQAYESYQALRETQQYILFASNAIFTAETIYGIRNEDSSWKNTVQGLISDHLSFVKSKEEFQCQQYSEEFLKFIRAQFGDSDKEIKDNFCPEQTHSVSSK
jgi:hypothetical protein